MTSPPDDCLDALWLTGLRWDDPDLRAVRATLPPGWAEAACTRRGQVMGPDPGEKARAVRDVVAGLRGELPADPPLPARARALLCGEVDRETGRRWAANAPAPRRGFVASAALRGWLARLARRGAP